MEARTVADWSADAIKTGRKRNRRISIIKFKVNSMYLLTSRCFEFRILRVPDLPERAITNQLRKLQGIWKSGRQIKMIHSESL